MQLTIEVLPAPLGPMIENSSPPRIVKLTSVSARTPPNRNDTPRTSNVVSTQILPEKRRVWRSSSCGPILARPNRQDHATIHVSRRWHTGYQVLAPCAERRRWASGFHRVKP